jgi:hypothetical protein
MTMRIYIYFLDSFLTIRRTLEKLKPKLKKKAFRLLTEFFKFRAGANDKFSHKSHQKPQAFLIAYNLFPLSLRTFSTEYDTKHY